MVGEDVVIIRAAETTDRYGNTELDWDDTTEFTLKHCAVAPISGSEDNDGRTAVITGMTVYASPDVATGFYGWSELGEPLEAVWPQDRLRLRGDEYPVDGRIFVWRNPFDGQIKGVEIQVVRVDG